MTTSPLMAENMIFNSGFELGDSGYSMGKYLRPDTNPQLKYEKAVVDTTSFNTGKQSLRIPNRFAEQGKLAVGDFKLNLDKEYTVSFAAKTEADNCIIGVSMVSCGPGAWNWDLKNQKFNIGKDWKTYEFTFKPKAGWTQSYYSLWLEFCHSKDAKPGSIWIDSLQLEQASRKGIYQPSANLEACSRFEKRVIVIPKDSDEIRTTVITHIINNSDKRVKAALTINLVEDLAGSLKETIDGASFELAKLNVDLAPHEKKSIDSKVDLKRYGAFRLDTVIKSNVKTATSSDTCVIIWPLEKKLVDLDKTFCSGINFAGGGQKMPPHAGELERPAYNVSMNHDDYLSMYSDLGIRFCRDWDYGYPSFEWKDIEPEQGKFDFKLADKTIDDATKHGMRVLPVLGGGAFIVNKKTGTTGWPDWLDQKCRTEEKCGDWGKTVKIPPTDLWRKYVRAIATHFKGKISHYEIINEANGFLRAEVYMELLKASYEEIKAADPAAKVVGFCATGDMSGNIAGFLDKCFNKGGLNYADVVSVHPYVAPCLGSATPADKQIDGIKAMLAKSNAPDKPLWNTEIYYLTKAVIDQGRCQPQDVAQRFLTDLGEGLKQSTTITANNIFKSQTQRFPYSYAETFEMPSGVFSIYNTLTKFFEGANPVTKFKWGNDTVCYVYECNGKFIAAFWNYGEINGLKLKLAATDSDVQLYDLFGNKTSLGTAPMLIGALPFYLEPKDGMDKDSFLSMLKKAQVEAAKPVEIGFARLVPENGWAVQISIRNTCGVDIQGNLGVNGKGVVGLDIVDIAMPAGAEKVFTVPVKLESNGPTEVIIKVYTGGRILDFQSKLSPPPKVYPVRKDVTSLQQLKSGNASFSASYDETYLHLSFYVKDNTPSGEGNGREPWEQDCIEIFIDAGSDMLSMKYPDLYTDKVARFFILPYAPAGEKLRIWPKSLENLTTKSVAVNTQIHPDGYSATLDIPLKALLLSQPLKGKFIGFDVSIDYSNTINRQSTESWNSEGKAYKSRLSFGFINFVTSEGA